MEFTERSGTFQLEKKELLLGLLDYNSLGRGVWGEGVRGVARRSTLADYGKRCGQSWPRDARFSIFLKMILKIGWGSGGGSK